MGEMRAGQQVLLFMLLVMKDIPTTLIYTMIC